jgi:hypothetical protein
MKQIFEKHAKRAGLALAAVAVFAALGTGTAQAEPTFTSADIVLDRFGNLECVFRETGRTLGGQVRYDCTAQYVGFLQQCMLRRKAVGNSKLLIFEDVSAHEVENFDVSNNGQVRAAIVTQIPESEDASLLCTAPSELTVTAVRWCNAALVDLTNGITCAEVGELFAHRVSNGSGSVPSCAVLANGPFATPGE